MPIHHKTRAADPRAAAELILDRMGELLAGYALRSAQQAAQPAAGEVEGPARPPSENTALLTVRVPPEDKKPLRRLQLETGRKGPDLLREALGPLLRKYGRGNGD